MFSIAPLVRHTVAALVTTLAVAPAQAVVIETGSYFNSGMGAEFATAYDTLTLAGQTVTIATPAAPVVVTLGEFTFEVGPNCNSCSLTPTFDALIDVTVDGMTRQLDLPYAWYSTGPNDYLSFTTPAPLMFDFGSLGLVTIAVESIGTLTSPIGVVHGNLNATVAVTPVPEPASYALMLAGFGVIAFVARRRQG